MDISISNDIESVKLLDSTRDIRLEDLENSLRRAIQSPIGFLSLFTLSDQGLDYIDSDIGTSVYELLAEPLTSDFISNLQSAIYQAINTSDLLVEVSNLTIQVIDLNSINVVLEVKDLDGTSRNISVNL